MMKPAHPPANENKKTDKPQREAEAAKQHDRESPDKRGQAANTTINLTHQGDRRTH